jgi:hypothetical protein
MNLFHRLKRAVDPDRLLLRLSPAQRSEMIARGVLLSQFAIPIGSAVYFLLFQVAYQTDYNGDQRTWFYLKDAWDRLPVHLQNLFGNHMFGITGQSAPPWWVTARHDSRHVLIGYLAVLLIGAFGVGLKKYKPVSRLRMASDVPLSFLAASAVAAAGIWFFAWHPVAGFLNKLGTDPNLPYVGDLIGKGTVQVTLIGVLAGLAARKILAPTFAQLQLMSIDRNIAQGDALTGWKRFVYPANYRNRFGYRQSQLIREKRKPGLGSRWMGIALSFAAPVALLLLAFGIWLNYFGPAAGAH